jgi:hypothetical protein
MSEPKIYIFGAHSRGQTLAVYLRYLHPEITVEAYLYDNEEENPAVVDGSPVLRLGESGGLHTEYPVYIGTRGVSFEKITGHLKQVGFRDIRPVTVAFDLEIRNQYLKKFFAEQGRAFVKIDDCKTVGRADEAAKQGLEQGSAAGAETAQENGFGAVCVYVANSAFDKALQAPYSLQSYEKTIQVGAALTDRRLFEGVLTDDTGDNISARNQQFCELTALYWIWKQAKEDIVGLVHYRRHFTLPENWQARMRENHVDVILPIPLYVAPSLEGNFRKRHDPSDWDYLMEYWKQKDFAEYQEADRFFQSNLYSPCNMFIMKREVLDDLCKWLFPMLFAVAEHGGTKEDTYLNRYPGFISERLMTFFFEKHRDRYQVVYADKNFLP